VDVKLGREKEERGEKKENEKKIGIIYGKERKGYIYKKDP
jgi:hypothetical protein